MDDGKSDQIAGEADVDFVALQPGTKIGRYEVLAVLGQGGFGITYRARDIQLNREVAIKEYLPTSLAIRRDGITVLPRSTKVAEDFTWGRDRFVSEGQTLATLHRAPGIVRVFDFLEINGTAYIVMEMLHGDTLEGRLKKSGRLDAAGTDRILWTLLDGLEQVHNAGFLHRDIKPANILLDEQGNPTLIDFGASRAAMAGRTTAMTAIFTPGYAAAEQMTSAKQGPWTDIYGLSATLYHAIIGKAPPNAFDRMLDDDYEPIAKLATPGFPAGLLAGIDAGLAVRASDRPQSIAGWRTILSMAAPGADDATRLASPKTVDPAATVVARSPTIQPPPARQPTIQPPPSAPTTPVAAPEPAAMPTAPAAKRRAPLYAGIAALVLLLAGGGGYLALSPGKPAEPQGASLQGMKVEDLERVLAERRAADAAAAEKKRLEEEARRKAEAEATATNAADAELVKAEAARRQAEAELAKLRADIEARRQEAQNEARRLEAEAAQRKAEAEMAALKQAEDDARRRAAAEAEAKRLADEALAKAQAERQKAEEEAQKKAAAEAKEKADASAKQIAEAEARAKADAEAKAKADAEAKVKAEADAKAKAEADAAAGDRRAAEAAENGLRLTVSDRQRVQVALTSLGFDTRGSDGAFGPRSRNMIAAWQKARNQPTTGFLTGAQNQALLREATPALQKFDEEQKKKEEEEKKKAEEAKKKAEEEAKARAAAPAPAPATAAAPPAAPASGFDGSYGGNSAAFAVSVRVTGATGTGTATVGRCGSGNLSLRISPAGEVMGSGSVHDWNCGQVPVSVEGRITGNQMALRISGPRINSQVALTKGVVPAPQGGGAAVQSAPAPQAAAPVVGPGGLANGTYSGGLSITGGGHVPAALDVAVRIAAGRGSGSITTRACGASPINLTVDPSGAVVGTAKFHYVQCNSFDARVTGRVNGARLFIEVNSTTTNARGTANLSRSGD